MTTEPLVICTAWNAAMAKHGELCSESILQHIRRVEARGGTGITFVSQLIPDDYPRPPSWFKLSLVAELLKDNPHVLWIDVDALLLDQGDIREGMDLSELYPLQLCEDDNGLNAGVMWWNKGIRADLLLSRIESLSAEFMNHTWWETAAFNKDCVEHHEDYTLLRKDIYNSYTNELSQLTKILHFAGFSNEDRIKLMEAFEIALRRNGQGPPR